MLSRSSEVPKVDNCVLSKEQRSRKEKPRQKPCFLDKHSHETQLQNLWRNPEVTRALSGG